MTVLISSSGISKRQLPLSSAMWDLIKLPQKQDKGYPGGEILHCISIDGVDDLLFRVDIVHCIIELELHM